MKYDQFEIWNFEITLPRTVTTVVMLGLLTECNTKLISSTSNKYNLWIPWPKQFNYENWNCMY